MTETIARALAPAIRPGVELGVIYREPGGGLADLVLLSGLRTLHPKQDLRSVVWLEGCEATVWYATTHCDSGVLLASLASRDVVVGG